MEQGNRIVLNESRTLKCSAFFFCSYGGQTENRKVPPKAGPLMKPDDTFLNPVKTGFGLFLRSQPSTVTSCKTRACPETSEAWF